MKKVEDKKINELLSRAEEYRKKLSKPTLEDFKCTEELGRIFTKCFNINDENK